MRPLQLILNEIFAKGVFNFSPWKHIVWLAALTKFSNLSIIDSRDYQFWCKTNLARQVDKLLNLRGWYCYIFQIHCDISSVLKCNYCANNSITLLEPSQYWRTFLWKDSNGSVIVLVFPPFFYSLYSTSPILVFPEIFPFHRKSASALQASWPFVLFSFSRRIISWIFKPDLGCWRGWGKIETSPSVKYAKDWLDQLFLFPGLEKGFTYGCGR